MSSETYLAAKKEFTNCIVLSPICLGVSLYMAFKEWRPIMKAEKQKELEMERSKPSEGTANS